MQRLISFMTLGLLLVLMSASELFAQPSSQASNIAFSNITATGVRVVFTRGDDGDSRIVVFTPVGQDVDEPVDGQQYSGTSSNFVNATPVSSGSASRVVYQGTLRAVNITGLTPGTEYHVMVYERFNSGWLYQTSPAVNNPRTFFTNPAPPASIGAGSHDQTTNSFRANWTDPNTGGWDGFQLTVSTVNTFASALTWFSNLEVGDVNEYDVDIDLSPNTTYFYRVRTMQDARVSSWASYTSGVSTLPVAPTLSTTAVELCLNETYIVAPTAPTPGMGAEQFRFFAYTTETGSVTTWDFPLMEIDLTPQASGITTWWIATYSNKTGLVSEDRVAIAVRAYPSGNIANAGNDITACVNNGIQGLTVQLAGNAAGGDGNPLEPQQPVGEWTVISGPGTVTFGSPNNPTANATFTQEGTYVLRWTITQEKCTPTSDDVTVTVYELPNQAMIHSGEGFYDDVCGLTLEFDASVPNAGTGTWSYTGAAGGSFSDDNDPEATFTAVEYGTYTFTWTVSNGTCTPTSDYAEVTFFQTPTVADAGDDIIQCGTAAVNLDANVALVGTGVWSYEGPGTITFTPHANAPDASITASAPGSYTLTWTISNGTCSSTYDDVVVTWSPDISDAELEEEGNMIGCGDMAVELWAIEPLVGEGEWSVISSPANSNYSFDYTDLANAYFEVDTYGSYVLRWTVSDPNGICPDDFVNVTISFSESPTSANAGFDKNVCGLTGALEGNEPGVGTGTWSLTLPAPGTVTSWDTQDPTTNVTVSHYGTYSFEWAIESGCATSSDVVNVTFWNPMNGWFAGPDVTICGTGSGNTGELLGVVPTTYGAGVYGEWTKVSGPGVPTFIDWNAYDTEVWFNLPGTYVIRWTGYNGPCTAEDEITVIVTTPPTVTFGTIAPVCATAAPIALTTGSPAGGVYSGEGVSSGVNGWEFDPSETDGVGTYTLTYTYTAGNGCSASATTVISVTAPPEVEFDPIQPLCISANAVTLTSGSPEGGEYSGTGVVSGQFNPATAGVGTHTLTYTYSSGGCSNTATTDVVVNPLPEVTWTGDLGTYCTTQNSFIQLPFLGSPSSGSYSGVGLSGSLFNPSIAGVGTHTLTYTYTDINSCVNTATNTVIVSLPPTVTFDAIEDVCVGSESFSLISYVSPSGGTFTGSGVSGNDFDPSSVAAGTYTLTYTVTAGVCSDSETQTIVVKELPSITFESSYLAVCEDASDVDLFDIFAPSLSGGTFSGNGVSGNMFDPNGANVVIGSNTITYTATGPNGCSNSSTVTIWVDEKPLAVWAFLGDEVCVNSEDIDISHIQPVDVGPSYNYSYSISENGDGLLSGSTFTPSQAGTYTVTLTITNGQCTTTVDREIIVNPLPEVEWETTLNAVCVDATPVTLAGATPIGGTYSGEGVTSGVFTPSAAGAGTHTLTYTYTDIETGCVNTATNTIVVNPLPTVTWTTEYNAVCIDAEPITLTGGSPAGVGGVYSGAGVSSGVFNPSVAGAGTHTLTYTYTDGNGCVNTATNSIVVNPLPVVTWTTEYDAVCIDAQAFALSGGSPTVGTYTGSGVSSGLFNPSVAGAGTHTLTYTYTDGNGCTNTATNTIVVNALILADAGDDEAAELGSLTYTLDGNSASTGTGTWTKYSGPGTVITYSPNANTNNASVEVDEYGVYVFRWTITNGACTSYDDVTITFEPNDEAATKLALEIPANVVHGVPFTATIKTLNEINVEVAPDATVNFTVAKTFGNSVLTGTATGSIVPPATSATLTLTLTSADELIGEAGVELTATDNADELTDGVDVTNVLPIAPPVQATGLAFTGKSSNSISFVWDKLDAAGAVVVGRRSALTVPNSIQLVPGTTYPGSASWGAGHQFTSTTYSVYSGAGGSLTVTGLTSVTNYAFKVFAYNGSGSLINYNNSNRSDWSNNRGTATEKDAFAAEELPLIGDNILSSSYVTPNPARDNVSLAIDLAKSASLNISFFTTDGKEVIVAVDNSMYNAGRHNFNIPLNGLAAGVYSVVIRADNEVIINNVVVMP